MTSRVLIRRHSRCRVAGRKVDLHRDGLASGEVEALAAAEGEVAATPLVGVRVVLLDEAAGASHQELREQGLPVGHVLGPLESGEARERRPCAVVLVPAGTLGVCRDRPLRPQAQVVMWVEEQRQLRGEVAEAFVVRRRGEQQHPRVVVTDVRPQRLVVPAALVAQVVRLIDDDEAVAPGVGEFAVHHRQRHHPAPHLVAVQVVLPHTHEVLGARHEGLEAVLLLQEPRHGGAHECLAEADHVADHRSALAHDDPGRDLHRGRLERQQFGLHRGGQPELHQPLAGLLRQVVRHLEVDEVRVELGLRGPRSGDRLAERHVHRDAQRVVPASLEPRRQLGGGVAVDHVGAEFALLAQAGACEIRRADIADPRRGGVGAMAEIELGVKPVGRVQPHLHGALVDLTLQRPQGRLVGRRRDTHLQLGAEILDRGILQPVGGPVVHQLRHPTAGQATHLRAGVLGDANQNPRPRPLLALTARQTVHRGGDQTPAPQVEVADRGVQAVRRLECPQQLVAESLADVVQNLRHGTYSLLPKIIRSRRLPAASKASSIPQALANNQSARSVMWRSFTML